ncbi:unnamed protein product [Caenorhabditis auriculariae]|uniref:Neurotransmitter-gated ion-channel ligand-binding domain-containing protein n=1 Tax=Caenorhabditis auriculariae TaxID=2777116 RepID=A0A8S1HG95_9PELO|nr:unnamed protein product [Caenorhabditis auriculariae]
MCRLRRLLLFSVLLQQYCSLPWCKYAVNLTKTGVPTEDEDCIYYYLLTREQAKIGQKDALTAFPPPGKEIAITIENVVIRYVQLSGSSNYQFDILGDIFFNWHDDRLKWDSSEEDGEEKNEWHNVEHFYLFNSQGIWSPHLIDHTLCMNQESCQYSLDDVDVTSSGLVYARLQFRYSASCAVDYKKFPEEHDTCCIFFTAFEPARKVKFEVEARQKEAVVRPVYAQRMYNREMRLEALVRDHSPWVVTERSVSVAPLEIESLEALQVCVVAQKQMSTVRLALTLPVTLATFVMLASPLFGDLRMQLFVKMFTLLLQTICFLYLCSITPPNDLLYEFIFTMSFISIMITLMSMAFSRVRRNVPPSHRVYLVAKLINRVICCIEPERVDAYQRYVDAETEQRTTSEVDYTQDWRHIYLAINNMFSGMTFSCFLIITFFEFF